MAKEKQETRFSAELLDELLEGQDAATVLRSDGLVGDLKRALAERMLNAEMDVHLGGETEQDGGNHRNGSSRKTVLSDDGELVLSIPRDRHGRFDPALIRKYQRRFPGFDDKIVALYARGMSTRDIQAHVGELYGIAISPDLVSVVTDSVIDEVRAWQARPLESTYAIVYFDALRVKIRDEGLVRNKAVYLAIGVRCSGHKDILGLWIEQTEGAKFWLRVMNDLKARGVQDILLAIVDGLQGFPDAITAVFPDTIVQTCIVHLIRNSIRPGGLEGPQALGSGSEAGLPGRRCRDGRTGAGRIRRRRVGTAFPDRGPELAAPLGPGHSVLRFPRGRAEDRVHDERDREPAQRRAQEHPEQRAFPERRGRHETHLAGLAPSHGEVEESPGRLGGGQGTIRDSVRRSIQAGGLTNGNSSHTKFLTPPPTSSCSTMWQ